MFDCNHFRDNYCNKHAEQAWIRKPEHCICRVGGLQNVVSFHDGEWDDMLLPSVLGTRVIYHGCVHGFSSGERVLCKFCGREDGEKSSCFGAPPVGPAFAASGSSVVPSIGGYLDSRALLAGLRPLVLLVSLPTIGLGLLTGNFDPECDAEVIEPESSGSFDGTGAECLLVQYKVCLPW